MGDRTFHRLVDEMTGNGWLLSGEKRLGRVSYAIEVRDVWTWHDGRTFSGTEVTVLLRNHSIDAHLWKDQPLTLVLRNDLRIGGFISADGTQFVRTGTPDVPRSASSAA